MTRLQKIVLGLLLLLIGVAFTWYQTTWRDASGASVCAGWYRAARTAADSAQIDRRGPPIERGSGEHASPMATCGEMRRLGKIR